jgi:hypothetical protein
VIGRANWREDAACLHADPDLFFPIASIGPALDQIDEAKRRAMRRAAVRSDLY